MGLFGIVPEKERFQARGSGFLWSRARKGSLSGTGTDSILHCRPQVSSQKKDTCRGVERFSSILPHLNSNWSYIWQKLTEVRKE